MLPRVMASRARGLVKSLHQPEYQALCALLAEARRKAGLSQQEVAKRLRRPQSFVAKYEGGERRLDVIEFLSVSEVLGADPIRLLRGLLRKIG
jgi:transcriptional regulator with XRE-family HTH domain